MTVILDGQKLAKEIRNDLKSEIEEIQNQSKRVPSLSVVIVGEDPASQTYVASKEKQAKAIGMKSEVIALDKEVSQIELLETIKKLNQDQNVDGILVQLPLPKHLDEDKVIDAIDSNKDVDGLHPYNVGMLHLGRDGFIPCTPKGIMRLLETYKVPIEGKRALVIGRSRLVGSPIAALLTKQNATVTVAHSRTQNLETLIAEHDIIVVAIGRKEFVKASWIKENQVLIDVGIHRGDDGLVGDVEKAAYQKAAYATPVPKGVGPMTIAMLLENTLISYRKGQQHDN